ncbi:MAG: indole-3-glycerol-phosphate synthase [Gemmatimonadaceae bacterium]
MWSPPSGALGRLCANARERALRLDRDALQAALAEREHGPSARSLVDALSEGGEVAVIAEIKRRSPSKGAIRPDMPTAERAIAYQTGGARALSVLTEPMEFGGSDRDLVVAAESTHLPVLKKDFHVEPIHVWEARSLGASALLLIARALGPEALSAMASECRLARIECLVEVRSEDELEWALASGAVMIGVNTRDLESLVVDPALHERLIPRVPSACIAVAESGVASREDVERVARAGADAVLVGSSLSMADDPVAATSRLVGVERAPRAS